MHKKRAGLTCELAVRLSSVHNLPHLPHSTLPGGSENAAYVLYLSTRQWELDHNQMISARKRLMKF